MTKFEILNDCEIVIFDGNSGEKKSLKIEDTQTLNVRFEDGRFSMIDAKNVKKTS